MYLILYYFKIKLNHSNNDLSINKLRHLHNDHLHFSLSGATTTGIKSE